MSSTAAASWRQVELTGRAPEEFSSAWKLSFMLQNPVHFPAAMAGTAQDIYWLWLGLIGVLGLFDTHLVFLAYSVLSLLLIAACLTPFDCDFATRARIAAVAAGVALAYCVSVLLILYVIWTPVDE